MCLCVFIIDIFYSSPTQLNQNNLEEKICIECKRILTINLFKYRPI